MPDSKIPLTTGPAKISKELENLELSVRTVNCLEANGVTNLNAFMALRRPEVIRWKNAGAKTWREIDEMQRYLTQPPHKTQEAALFDAVKTINRIVSENNGRIVIRVEDGVLHAYRDMLRA